MSLEQVIADALREALETDGDWDAIVSGFEAKLRASGAVVMRDDLEQVGSFCKETQTLSQPTNGQSWVPVFRVRERDA